MRLQEQCWCTKNKMVAPFFIGVPIKHPVGIELFSPVNLSSVVSRSWIAADQMNRTDM